MNTHRTLNANRNSNCKTSKLNLISALKKQETYSSLLQYTVQEVAADGDDDVVRLPQTLEDDPQKR